MSQPYQVHIIEDDSALAKSISTFLRAEGFEVTVSEDGATGIQRAFAAPPDLIICDIAMEKISGYDVFRTFQQSEQTSVIPFIFLTAKVDRKDVRLGMQLGADDYITKPFDYKDLLISINTQLKKRKKIVSFTEFKYQNFIDNAPVGILMLEGHKVVNHNPIGAQHFGYPDRGLVGMSLLEMVIESQRGSLQGNLELCADGLQSSFKASLNVIQKGYRLKRLNFVFASVRSKGKLYTIATIAAQSEQAKGLADSLAEAEDLSNALQALEQEKEGISRQLFELLVPIFRDDQPPPVPHAAPEVRFTRREKEVLQLICQGLSNQEIADKLSISHRTVEGHRTNLIVKTDSKNIIEVIIFAIKHKIVDI